MASELDESRASGEERQADRETKPHRCAHTAGPAVGQPGAQAYSIALNRAEEASSDEMARDWSVVAETVARKSGVRSSLLDALFG